MSGCTPTEQTIWSCCSATASTAGNSVSVVQTFSAATTLLYAHSLQYARQVLREFRKRQVTMGIYEHERHVSRPYGRRP